MAGFQLLEEVGLELGVVVDGREDLLAFRVARGFDEVGELGRMEPRQPRMRHAQAHGRHVAGERLDVGPVEHLSLGDARRNPARDDPPENAARPDVDPDDAPPAVEPRELDVVRAPQPRAVDVDQLPVEHVLPQQHLLRAPLERPQVEPVGREHDLAVLDLRDRVAGDEDVARRDPREHGGDRRIAAVTEPDDQVVDAAELAAGASHELAAEDQRQVEDPRRLGRRGHRTEDAAARGQAPAQRSASINREWRRSAG